MTSQERPVEEQNEVEKLAENGATAVADQELPPQTNQEESANAAEDVAASSADVERTASATAQAEATTETESERALGDTTSEPATVEDAAVQTEAAAPTTSEPSVAAEPAVASTVETADDTPEVPAETASVAEVAETPSVAEAPADAAPTADDAPAAEADDAPAAELVADTPAETPASEEASFTPVVETPAETPTETPATEEASFTPVVETPATEEASFTPVTEADSSKPRRVKDLHAGMELEGRVTSIALYGIFVDIGVGRDGLVHISEMSNTRIDSPSDLVQIGDTVKVRVKSVEPDGRRISLTMRTPDAPSRRGGRKKPDLDREQLSTLRIGDTVEGTVTGIAPFGIFVDIGVGKDGLVHISELSEGRIDKAEDAVQVGQSYAFKILEVDAEGTRISLSLRRAARAQRLQTLEKGQILEGTISGLAPFGAFVDIGVGRDGLVHISELSENRVGKVEDVVKVGDKVQVRVLEMEANSKRISLSMILEDKPREEQSAQPTAERERPQDRQDRQQDRPRREFPTLQDRQERQERVRRDERRRDRGDVRQPLGATSEVYATAADEVEDEPANATLEDLVSKFGGGRRADKRRPDNEDEEEELEETDRSSRRQRDAIRRTLQQMGDDE